MNDKKLKIDFSTIWICILGLAIAFYMIAVYPKLSNDIKNYKERQVMAKQLADVLAPLEVRVGEFAQQENDLLQKYEEDNRIKDEKIIANLFVDALEKGNIDFEKLTISEPEEVSISGSVAQKYTVAIDAIIFENESPVSFISHAEKDNAGIGIFLKSIEGTLSFRFPEQAVGGYENENYDEEQTANAQQNANGSKTTTKQTVRDQSGNIVDQQTVEVVTKTENTTIKNAEQKYTRMSFVFDCFVAVK